MEGAGVSGVRLELASGYNQTPGFVHLDGNAATRPDIVADFRALPMFADGSVAEIRAIDCLEHCSYTETDAALAEWARVLAYGGLIYIQVPDAALIMRWFVESPEKLINRCPSHLPQTALAGAAWRLLGGHNDGVYAKAGDDWKWNCHGAMFSEASLTDALERVGLAVETLEINGHPNLCAWAVKV